MEETLRETELELFADENLVHGLQNIWNALPCQWPLNLCRWHLWPDGILRSEAGEEV